VATTVARSILAAETTATEWPHGAVHVWVEPHRIGAHRVEQPTAGRPGDPGHQPRLAVPYWSRQVQCGLRPKQHGCEPPLSSVLYRQIGDALLGAVDPQSGTLADHVEQTNSQELWIGFRR
jgi:hypothetical protein